MSQDPRLAGERWLIDMLTAPVNRLKEQRVRKRKDTRTKGEKMDNGGEWARGRPRKAPRHCRVPRLGLPLMLLFALVVSACGTAANDDAPATPEKEAADSGDSAAPSSLTVSFHTEPINWDYTVNFATGVVFFNVVEPLLEKADDGTFKPLLAETWDVSDDGLEYTFKVREATFHDGTQLTADDVVYSLETNRAAPQPSVSVGFEHVDAIEKLDDRTVKVTLSRPSRQFLESMARQGSLIIPEGSSETLADGPIGTGPYVFGEWRSGSSMTMTRFDEYWGESPFFEEIRTEFFQDDIARINAILAGDIDLGRVRPEDASQIDQINETEGLHVVSAEALRTMWVIINASDETLQDERYRQAIAHAIDREALLPAWVEASEPTCVAAAPSVEWWSDYCPYPYDPSSTSELLAEAGDLSITFSFIASIDSYSLTSEVLAAQFEDAGISVELEGLESATYGDRVLRSEVPDYQVSVLGGPQPLEQWTCPGWVTVDCVSKFDELLAEADAAADPAEWEALRRTAMELQADRAYVIPLYTLNDHFAGREEVVGVVAEFRPNLYITDFRAARWQDD